MQIVLMVLKYKFHHEIILFFDTVHLSNKKLSLLTDDASDENNVIAAR